MGEFNVPAMNLKDLGFNEKTDYFVKNLKQETIDGDRLFVLIPNGDQ